MRWLKPILVVTIIFALIFPLGFVTSVWMAVGAAHASPLEPSQRVGFLSSPLPGGQSALLQDGPTSDFINRVQIEAARLAGFPVELSCAIPGSGATLPVGPVTWGDVQALYPEEDPLAVVEISGAILLNALESPAATFQTYRFDPQGPQLNPECSLLRYGIWSGIQYRLDLTHEVGQRVFGLAYQGQPVTSTMRMQVATNRSYAEEELLPLGGALRYASDATIQESIVSYLQAHTPLDPNSLFEANWSLYPDQYLRPEEAISASDFTSLLTEAYFPNDGRSGSGSSGGQLCIDPSRQSWLFVDPATKRFRFSAGSRDYGFLPAPLMTTAPGFIHFLYLGPDLYLQAWLQPGESMAVGYDLKTQRYLTLDEHPGAWNTERALTQLTSVGFPGTGTPVADWTLLRRYPDWTELSSWSAAPYTQAVGMGLLDNWTALRPQAALSNAAALGWIEEARYPELTLLTTNDFHGQLEPKIVNGVATGGAAFLAAAQQAARAGNPHGTLLLDEGDIMQATLISNYFQGASSIDVFNQLGVQASAFGNHDFDWGQTVLQERIAQAHFPWLSCNIFLEGSDQRPAWIQPSTMLEVKGIRVGLVGATTLETPHIVMPGNLNGLEFLDPAPIINQISSQLRSQGAQMVVVLAHFGGEQTPGSPIIAGEVANLAESLKGVDLLASGHSHTLLNGAVNGIPILQQNYAGLALGISRWRIDRLNGGAVWSTQELAPVQDDGLIPDQGISSTVDSYNAQIAKIQDQVIASVTGPIPIGDKWNAESPIGDLIADAFRWKAQAQIGIMNPGGIRSDLNYPTYPHEVTWGDCYAIQPFNNILVAVELTGAQIRDLLEQQWPPNQIAVDMLQISGFRYTYRAVNPPGSRVLSLALEDGTPILPDQIYKVASTSYLASGGESFTIFTQAGLVTPLGLSDNQALVDYILWKWGTPPANTPLAMTVEGRFQANP
ncbi:MAG: 5'-nucleotidase C-terminal domain-containing protein [Coprothermobacterota bacterium]|nr:5'-nucleotidase C-terminal domain-containing protein [Coprothermobacterota bacterium]